MSTNWMNINIKIDLSSNLSMPMQYGFIALDMAFHALNSEYAAQQQNCDICLYW